MLHALLLLMTIIALVLALLHTASAVFYTLHGWRDDVPGEVGYATVALFATAVLLTLCVWL